MIDLKELRAHPERMREVVHLRKIDPLSDTGCAMGRIRIAIFDNCQQKDGSVKVPAALRPFVKKDYIRAGAAS